MLFIAWVGTFCFAFCAAPQAFKATKEKHADGMSSLCLLLWLIGEICYITVIVAELGVVPWLLFNYLSNGLFLLIIIFYKVKSCRSQ